MNKYAWRIKEAELLAIKDCIQKEWDACMKSTGPSRRERIAIRDRYIEIESQIADMRIQQSGGVYDGQ